MYTLVECEPNGYLIYHDESGIFAESSLYSPSPYKSFTGTLYYGGPASYYAQTENGLVHTITNEKVTLNPTAATQYAEEINEVLINQKDIAVLNYIEYGAPYSTMQGISTYAAGDTYVEDYTVLKNLKTDKQIGYLDTNACGYIAGGMAMLYLQAHSGLRVIPSQYLASNGIQFKDGSFTKHLRDAYGNGKNLTTASTLAAALNGYFDVNNNLVTANWSLYGSGNTTRSFIDSNQPVMAGGQYASDPNDNDSKEILHFILAYGYSATDFIVHYGWANFSEVRVNNGLFILQSIDYVVLKI